LCKSYKKQRDTELYLRLHREKDELLRSIEEDGAATGEGQLMILSEEIQKAKKISRFATASAMDCPQNIDLQYRVGPTQLPKTRYEYKTNIPSLIPWVEAYASGQDPGHICDIWPSKVEVEVPKTSLRVVVSASYLESWIFTLKEKIVLLNPSTGTMYRLIESGCYPLVIMTSQDPQWERHLKKEFSSFFTEKRPLKFGILDDIQPDDLVYHGSLGLQHVTRSSMNIALELNPYSRDIRTAGCTIKRIGDGYSIVMNRKGRQVHQDFDIYSKHFRVDPVTLSAHMGVLGDGYFFATTVDPSVFNIRPSVPRYPVAGDMMCFDVLPPYEKFKDLLISQDDLMVYDVKGPMTCQSRRHYTKLIAAAMNKEVAPLVKYGKFVAYPYSSEFTYLGSKCHGECTILLESPSMSATNRVNNNNGKEGPKAVSFCFGDFGGRKVTPLERYGSTYDVATFIDPDSKVRYVDFTKLDLTKHQLIVTSFNNLLSHLSLILNMVNPTMSEICIDTLTEREPLEFEEDMDPDHFAFLSNDNYNKSLRQRMIEKYGSTSQYFTLEEMYLDFPECSKFSIQETLVSCPTSIPHTFNDEVMWTFGSTSHPFAEVFDSDRGICSYSNRHELKYFLFGEGKEVVFEDDLNLYPVERIQFCSNLGYQLVQIETRDDCVVRTFMRCPLKVYDF
jgi:hypothetical protein